MIYAQSLAFLYGLQKHGIKLGLETVERLLARLHDPHLRYPVLHIGGTNGKGSTAAMTAAILQAAGYRVGLYTSPHLVDFRERIQIDGEPIAEEALVALTDRVRTAMGRDLDPTFFEFTTAIAFEHFADMKVDIAVIEVGMGGRFDATNVVRPVAAAITTIALDHQAHLGTTVSAIAREKGGIIKPGTPLVVGKIDDEAWDVIRSIAEERRAPVRRWGADFQCGGDPTTGFEYRRTSRSYSGLVCRLAGHHQLQNAACALALLDAASDSFAVSEHAVRDGLRTVRWEGRLEVVDHDPLVVLDGAHNPAAASVVADYLKDFRLRHPGSRLILVLAVMRDKDREGFLRVLLPVADEVVVTAVQMARSATVRDMLETPVEWPPFVHAAPSVPEALVEARRRARPVDLICVTGSLMLIGEVKALLRGCELSLLRG